MNLEQEFYYLVVVIGFCGALELNTTACVKNCIGKIFAERNLCDITCLQESLGTEVEKAIDSGTQLPKPAAPTLVEAGWQTIRLSLNSTELKTYSDLDFILEVKPDWGPQDMGEYFVVFPYTKKYHHTNQSTYLIEDLEPNTGYQFRMIAFQFSRSSSFSDWSEIVNTTRNCTKNSCGVTNIRLELKSIKKFEQELKSNFRWKPSIRISEGNEDFRREIVLLSYDYKRCGEEFFHAKKLIDTEEADELMHQNRSFYSFDENGLLEYNCWYKFGVGGLRWTGGKFAWRSRIFHVPDCIRIKNVRTCSCDSVVHKYEVGSINATFKRSLPGNVTMFLSWSDRNWRKSANLTHFLVRLEKDRKDISKKKVNAFPNVTEYNTTIYNLTYGKKHYLRIYGYHKDHCLHEYIEHLQLNAKPSCENVTCQANSTCQRVDYLGKYRCQCNKGFRAEGENCIVKDPCGTLKPCGANETCTQFKGTGKYNCSCRPGFQRINKTCVYIEDKQTGPVPDPNNNKGVIVAAILTPLVVLLLAICVIIWLKKRHKKRLNFMERELEYAVDVGLRNGDHSIDENNQRILNCIYVSQDNVQVIPEHLLELIHFYELLGDAIKCNSVIGRGAFGKVYIGEAREVNGNPDWTTVAIKTLAEWAGEDEFFDFLREIEIMKDIKKHRNVIQMFGCCIRSRPICLVLEFAPGGNLLNYLRSLKQKCKDIARTGTNEVTKSEKEKYQESLEPREIPLNTFSSPDGGNELTQLDGNGVKDMEYANLEIAIKVKEEIRTALDPKELESFARQIATGMKHISDLGIVHRDLAARNILIGEEKILKISDFGLSREGTYVKTTRGKIPFRWLSIEAIQERSYSTASDVWAFGVVLWEICTLGDMPYSSVSDKDLKNFLLSGKRLEKVDSCTDDIYEIMVNCWSHLPTDRPTFDELSTKLWDLEHKGNAYVNIESLMESIENEGPEKYEQMNKADNDSDDNWTDQNLCGSCDAEDGLDDVSAKEGMDNNSFEQSAEDLNANNNSLDKQYLVSNA